MIGHTISHDLVGNRTQKTSTLPGYAGGLSNYNANDQLTTGTYDANGNSTASIGQGAFDNLIWPTFDTFIWPTLRP